jgi:hypothetical protein
MSRKLLHLAKCFKHFLHSVRHPVVLLEVLLQETQHLVRFPTVATHKIFVVMNHVRLSRENMLLLSFLQREQNLILHSFQILNPFGAPGKLQRNLFSLPYLSQVTEVPEMPKEPE